MKVQKFLLAVMLSVKVGVVLLKNYRLCREIDKGSKKNTKEEITYSSWNKVCNIFSNKLPTELVSDVWKYSNGGKLDFTADNVVSVFKIVFV